MDDQIDREVAVATSSWMADDVESLYGRKLFLVDGEHNDNIRYTASHDSPGCLYPFVEVVDGKPVRAYRRDEVQVVSSWKRFHQSDTLLYQYNVIDSLTARNDDPDLMRHCIPMQASPGVTWQKIVAEVNERRTRIDAGNPPLFTIMRETEDFYVALTLRGFVKIAEGLPMYSRAPYEEVLGQLAKEMVTTRDYENYVSSLKPGAVRTKKFSDFWPKD